METNNQPSEVLLNNDNVNTPYKMTSEELSGIRTLGGLAALFAAGSIIPYIGFLIGLASIVLFLITFHKISKVADKKSIFSNIGFAYLISFVAGLALVIFIIFTFINVFADYHYDMEYFFSQIGSIKEDFLTTIIMIGVFFYVISITYAYLWKMSLDKTAVFFNDKAFKTAGLLYIIGAATIVVCGLGMLVTIAGHIVLAVAFFSLKPDKISV